MSISTNFPLRPLVFAIFSLVFFSKCMNAEQLNYTEQHANQAQFNQNLIDDSPDNIDAQIEFAKALQELEKQQTAFTKWEDLYPADFSPSKIYADYQEKIQYLPDYDSKAMDIYKQFIEELTQNSPINPELKGKNIRLVGFPVPLEFNEATKISEFYLVPYFGACIHLPPPPPNQIVFISTDEENAIDLYDMQDPIIVEGNLEIEGKISEIAHASYNISQASVDTY